MFLYYQWFFQNIEKDWRKIFRNKIISAFSQNDKNYKEIFLPGFFNILKEPLLAQKQTLHQQKALDLSYLEPEGKGRGTVRKVPHLLSAKDIEKKTKFNGGKSGCKKKFFLFNF